MHTLTLGELVFVVGIVSGLVSGLLCLIVWLLVGMRQELIRLRQIGSTVAADQLSTLAWLGRTTSDLHALQREQRGREQCEQHEQREQPANATSPAIIRVKLPTSVHRIAVHRPFESGTGE